MNRFLLRLNAGVVIAFLVAPVLVVVPMSFNDSRFLKFPPTGFTTRWYEEFFSDPEWTAALGRTLVVGGLAALLAGVLGVAASYAIVRGGGRVTRLVEPILSLPLVVPIVLYAMGIYLVATAVGAVGSLPLVVFAHAMLGLPFVVTNTHAALQTSDSRIELAARSLGAPPLRAFRLVVFPLVAPGILAGMLMALVMSFDEVVVAFFLAGDDAPTLPVKMYSSIRYELSPLVPVAATIMTAMFLSMLVVFLGIRAAFRRRQHLQPVPDNVASEDSPVEVPSLV